MTLDPHNLLAAVHPDLVMVIEAAKQEPQPFEVIYGIRTLAAEEQAVTSGHSETLHSRHLADPHYGGKAMAVDIGVFDNGQYVGDGPRVPTVYTACSLQILTAAKELGIDVQWGGQAVGAWTDGVVSHFRDWGHYQLDPAKYP